MTTANELNILEEDAKNICSRVDFSLLKNKTILITGASGLIGVHLVACLRLISSKIPFKLIAVIHSDPAGFFKSLTDFSGAEIFKGDITDYSFCKNLPQSDFIIHAAGFGQPLKFMESPHTTLKLNTFSTFLLFDKLNTDGHFLFVSSSEVYSGLKGGKYKEDQIGVSNTTDSRSCYIEGKRAGEAICMAYRKKGIKATSARLAHTYGPGTKPGDARVIMSFIEKAIKGRIQMLDKGKALRTYCYSEDAVEYLWNMLFSAKEPVYNVAGKSQTSILALAEKIGKQLNVPVLIPDSDNGVAGAPEEVQLDMEKAEKEFNKTSYISLDEGLKRTIKWVTNQLSDEPKF